MSNSHHFDIYLMKKSQSIILLRGTKLAKKIQACLTNLATEIKKVQLQKYDHRIL